MISLIFYILCPYTFVCFVIFYFYGSTSLISLFFSVHIPSLEKPLLPIEGFLNFWNVFFCIFSNFEFIILSFKFFFLYFNIWPIYIFFSIHPFLSYLPNQSIIISLYGHFFSIFLNLIIILISFLRIFHFILSVIISFFSFSSTFQFSWVFDLNYNVILSVLDKRA